MKLAEIIYESHSSDFKKVLTLKGKKRPYFTYDKNELRGPRKINKTNIFVEVNLSADFIVKICHKILATFGYSNNDLRIDVD